MASKSWAEIASYPKKRPTSSFEEDWPEAPSFPPLPTVVLTAQELEAGVKFSWSENPKHLQNSPSESVNDLTSDMDTTKETVAPEQAETPSIRLTPIFTVASLFDEDESNTTASSSSSAAIREGSEDKLVSALDEFDLAISDIILLPNTVQNDQDANVASESLGEHEQVTGPSNKIGIVNTTVQEHKLDSSSAITDDIIRNVTADTHRFSADAEKILTTAVHKAEDNVHAHLENLDSSPVALGATTDDTANLITSTTAKTEHQHSLEHTIAAEISLPADDESESITPEEQQKVDAKRKGKAKEIMPVEATGVDAPLSNSSATQLDELINITATQSDSSPPSQLQNIASASSSSSAGPSSTRATESRIGNISFSAAPDPGSRKPHPSGLTYQERYDLVKKQVEAARDLRRAKELKAKGEEAIDIVFVFNEPDGGVTEFEYHREVIAKESGYLRGRMPPPNEDGSKVGMFMGSWPGPIINLVFEFMYTHEIKTCEPPAEDNFYDMAPVAANSYQYVLACAFDCPRQRQYHLDCLTKIAEVAARQSKGGFRGYQLAYWEFSMCEEKLRMANRVVFQERLYPEMQRPFRVLLSRINAVMVPWLLRGKYMGVIMSPLWFEMKEYLPWREALWHYRATGQVQSDDWTWLGPQMTEQQISVALGRFGGGF